GAIIRKGGFGTPVVVSVVVFILYYIISMFGENLVEDLVIAPVQGMWGANIIILPLGVFLTYKATTDSTILNIETYFNVFKKIKKLFYRKMT
ncbi:MAG: LptF/LptG family permease, partial [Bacteroidota bacterium]